MPPSSDLFTPLNQFTMPKSLENATALSPGDVSAVIQMAWEDRTTFETIFERTGVTEPGVIKIMRAELTASSFKMWRTRMRGRVTKHRALRSPEMNFDDRAIADHRRANC
jgi:uncharacterized protein (TIGR03643 family)